MGDGSKPTNGNANGKHPIGNGSSANGNGALNGNSNGVHHENGKGKFD